MSEKQIKQCIPYTESSNQKKTTTEKQPKKTEEMHSFFLENKMLKREEQVEDERKKQRKRDREKRPVETIKRNAKKNNKRPVKKENEKNIGCLKSYYFQFWFSEENEDGSFIFELIKSKEKRTKKHTLTDRTSRTMRITVLFKYLSETHNQNNSAEHTDAHRRTNVEQLCFSFSFLSQKTHEQENIHVVMYMYLQKYKPG